MMFGFPRKKRAPRWEELDDGRKRLVASRLSKTINAMAGARYKVVSGADEWQREHGQTECKCEDQILSAYRRGRMLDLTRNAARNSPTFNGILKQFDLNAVGTKGGKAIFNFDDQELVERIRRPFASWTREADFFDGLSFNTVLKLILKTYILGGDMVLLFDDGMVEDSGKLLIYEPDEIGNTTEKALRAHYGASARQSLGRIYNRNGRFVGAVVSRSQRGRDTFDPDKSYFLKRDPDASLFDSPWIMPRNVFRVAQGRGVSPMSSSLATVLDLEDLCGFELAAAKKNSQVIAQILQQSTPPSQEQPPSAFDAGTDFSSMTDEEIEAAVRMERESHEQTVTLDKVRSAGVIYQVLPENFRMELLDTKHPNQTMPDFIRFLAGRSAAPFGLTEQYATLKAAGGDFKAEQLMTQPVFAECQKFLEQICDWALLRWSAWASRRGLVDLSGLEDGWLHSVSWAWPRMNELDEQAYQNATQMKLKNLTGSYLEYYGPDWKEKLMQVQSEIDWCKSVGLPHPAYEMISGGERTGADDKKGTEQCNGI